MIEVSKGLLVDEGKVKNLRRMAEDYMDEGTSDKQFLGHTLMYAFKYLDLLDSSNSNKDVKKEDDSMKEKTTNLTEEIAAMEERDRLKSLLDRIDKGDMEQEDAVAYALAYFEGVSDVDADKPYTAGDILNLIYALYKCDVL